MKLDRLLALVALLVSLVALIAVLQLRGPQQQVQTPEPAFSAAEAQVAVDDAMSYAKKWQPVIERCRRYTGKPPSTWAKECRELPPSDRMLLLPRKQQDLAIVCLEEHASALRDSALSSHPATRESEIPWPAECEPIRDYLSK